MATRAKYIGPRDPDYRFGEIYEIRKIKGVSEEQAIAAQSIYGDFYAMPAELFAPIDYIPEKPKLFITKGQKKQLISMFPAAEKFITEDDLAGLLQLLKQRIAELEKLRCPNDEQRGMKTELQELYQRLFRQN